MDCPVGGDAVVQAGDSRVEPVAAEQVVATAGDPSLELGGDYWRHEVASRLERYRARRKPRAPRYPSLRLPFDSADSWLPVTGSALAVSATATAPERTQDNDVEHGIPQLVEPILENHPAIVEDPELFTNVIEFPRSASVPVVHLHQLAEPIFERPRIVEAPEVLPPPPALGGILMEPTRAREPERRAAADLALPSASLPRRMLAGLYDALILVGALAGFAGIFAWLNPQRPPLLVIASAAAIVGPIMWAAYEFLFTVYTGSTPGLRMARIRLVRFDGSATSRRVRRWRVLTSYLSAVALGLGYLWSVLDEDGLCWHDRITHTHVS
ncbi:MAG: RDD family protein [Acidobacteria bacterium]|nr:RDD family protein [Acidobacteriota bacterium]